MSVEKVDQVAIKISLQEDGTWVVENLQEKIKKGTKNIVDDFSRANKSLGKWLKNLAAAAGLFVGFETAIRGGISNIRNLVSETISFDTELNQVATLGVESTEDMSEGLLKMAGAMGTVSDLTRGTYLEISSSVPAERSLQELTEAAKAAAGGHANLYDTVNLGTTVWNVYNKEAQNMTHIFDVMWQVVRDGKTNMAQLSSYFGDFIPLAKEANLTFEEASGALAIMTQISGKTNISVTQLKAIMQAVIKPTKEAAEESERIGANFSTAAIKAMGFESWLRHLQKAVKDNNGDMSKLFGSVEGLSGILQLGRNDLKDFSTEMVKMEQVFGNNEENFEKFKNTLQGSYEEIKNKLQALYIQVIYPLMKEAAKWLRENSDSILAFAKNAISAFKSIIGFILQFKDAIIAVGKAWTIYFAITKVNALFTAFSTGSGVISQVVTGFINLKRYGLSSMDALRGSFQTATGSALSMGNVLKKIPTSLKITVALVGAEIAGKILAYLFDLQSKFYDREMAKIIKDTAEYEGKVSQMTMAINDFRMASPEYEEAFKRIKKRAEGFRSENESLIVTQQRVLNALKGTKEWRDYEEKLKNAGAAAGQLSTSLEDNLIIYNDLAKAVGNFTKEELETELEGLKKQGLLTVTQIQRLKELYKEVEKNREAYEQLATSMNILTAHGIKEQSKEISNILVLYGQHKDQVYKSNKSIEAWFQTITTLYTTALPQEKEKLASVTAELIEHKMNIDLLNDSLETTFISSEEIREQMENQSDAHLEAAHSSEIQQEAAEALNSLMKESVDLSNDLAESYNALGSTIGDILLISIDKLELGLKGINAYLSGKGSIIDGMQGLAIAGSAAAGILSQLGITSEKTAQEISQLTKGTSNLVTGISSGNPFQAIAGGLDLISAAISIFTGKSGEFEAAERMLRGLGNAADGYAEQIEELAKKLGGSGSAERAFGEFMAEIFSDMPSTESNFNIMFQKMMDYGAAVQWAGISLSEASKNYGEAFSEMVRVAEETGQLGSDKFLYLIENAEKLGLECEEITEYVESKTQTAFEGWQDAVKVFGDINIPMFQNMQKELDVIASIPPEIMAGIEGLTQSVIDYSEAHRVTKEEFLEFNNAATRAIEQLRGQNKTNEEIAIAMAPLLQKLAFLQSEFGFEVDATTQEMINQADKMGLLEGDYRDSNQIMKDGFGEVTGAIRELSAVLRGDFSGAFSDAADQAKKSAGIISGQFKNVQGDVQSTTKDIEKMGSAIKSVDADFVKSISGNTIITELNKMQNKVIETSSVTEKLGSAILPVHEQWVNSTAAMQDYLDNINDRVSELQDLIEAYKGNLTDLEEQEKAQYEAELAMLESLLDSREAALGISEELSSIQFDADSFADGISSIYDVFTALEQGIITTTEASQELGDSFNVMIANAKELGMEGSSSLLQFMNDVEASGLNVPEIKEYKTSKLGTAGNALGKYFSTFADTAAIRVNIADLEAELANARGSRVQELEQEIAAQKNLLDQGIDDIKKNADSMGVYTMGIFSSMIKNGASYMDAMKEMGPQLSQLKKIYEDNGIKVSGPLKEMLDLQKFIEQQSQLADRISASTEMLTALGDAGFLTKEIFSQFQTDAASQFEELVAKTGDTKKAYQMLGPELAKMLWYSEQYGYSLDANTQKMIAEASQQGVNLKAMIPAEEKMVSLLEQIVKLWGGDIPYAMQKQEIDINQANQDLSVPLSAAKGASFIVPPGYEDIQGGFPMLVHSGELVQVFPKEETSRISDMFKFQPMYKDFLNENQESDISKITVFNILKDDLNEDLENFNTKKNNTINSNSSPSIEINIPLEKINITFEVKEKIDKSPITDDLESFSTAFKKVITGDIRDATTVAAREFQRRTR